MTDRDEVDVHLTPHWTALVEAKKGRRTERQRQRLSKRQRRAESRRSVGRMNKALTKFNATPNEEGTTE